MFKILNWHKLNWKSDAQGLKTRLDTTQRKQVDQLMTGFFQEPIRHTEEITKKVQEFGSSGDFPTSVLSVLKNFRKLSTFDVGYTQFFDVKDFTSSKRNGFTMTDNQGYLTFNSMVAGEKAKLYAMSGGIATVLFLKYAGGLQWDKTLIDDEEFWRLEDNAVEFRNKWWADKASRHYALVEAVGAGQNIAWTAAIPAALATTDPTYYANRDAQTINAAIINIITNNINKGYSNISADGMMAEIVISCPYQLVQRLTEAVNLKLQPFQGSPNKFNWQIKIVPTAQYTATDKYYVILPFNKLISADRQHPVIYTKFDEMSYSELAVLWARWNATIGDSEQVQRCSIA